MYACVVVKFSLHVYDLFLCYDHSYTECMLYSTVCSNNMQSLESAFQIGDIITVVDATGLESSCFNITVENEKHTPAINLMSFEKIVHRNICNLQR